MKKEEVEQIVFSSLRQIAPDTETMELSPSDHFRDTLGLDSFDFLQLMVLLDEKLKINIPEKDYGEITTLGFLVDYLAKKVGDE